MPAGKRAEAERIQEMIAQLVARHPAGHNLLLIGGFRYRLLDQGARMSNDIDYHWSGDLEQKQTELHKLFKKKLLAEVRRRLGYDGSVAKAIGPDADSPTVRVVDLAFWKPGVERSRIEIPVEVTRIQCTDPAAIRVKSGTVYPTPTDQDMVESKAIAIFNRQFMRHRDVVDLFLFQDKLGSDSRERLAEKLHKLGIEQGRVTERIKDLSTHGVYHSKTVQEVIDSQLDPPVAENLGDTGGQLVLESALGILKSLTGGYQG